MKLAGIADVEEVPPAFPDDRPKQSQYLHNLAVNVVNNVFIPLDGIERVLRLSGERNHDSQSYCICRGGIFYGNFFRQHVRYTTSIIDGRTFSVLVAWKPMCMCILTCRRKWNYG